ncbi:hypothetical protein B0H14DRAFT_3155241 [Mycena olivaceomarginata]|nr:hypothetical protein B0H14DRAFT_3155241 [Mycena olivaceomarginata]
MSTRTTSHYISSGIFPDAMLWRPDHLSAAVASVPVLHDNGEHPHLIDIDQTCSTLRSNAIKILLVVGDDGSSSDAGRAAKRGRRGPVHRETRPSSSPSSSPFQSHVACSSHLPIRLRTLWLPYAPGDLARPPPRPATAPQLWHQRAPQRARAPRPSPCVPTLKHERLLGKSAVPIPPRVRGNGPCVARGASGSHTRIELRPGGRLEERGMRARPRVRLRCRAAAGGESESARGSGNASADAHGLAVRAGMKPLSRHACAWPKRGAAHAHAYRRTARTHDPPAVPRAAPARCDGEGESAERARAARRAHEGQHQRLPRLHLCLRLGQHRRHVRRRRGCGAYGERMRDACAALGGGGGRWAYGVGRRPRRVGIRRITGVRRRQGGREWRLGWGRVPRVHRAERRAEAGEGGRSALIGRER